MLPNSLLEKLNYKLAEIDSFYGAYDMIVKIHDIRNLDIIEITALASIFYSFNTGIENILHLIAREWDEDLLQEQNWHKMVGK